MSDEIIPCLTDLIRDWKHEQPDMHDIIIHKREDGIHIIINNKDAYVYGLIEADKVLFGKVYKDLRDNTAKVYESRAIYAADPDFFNQLREEFISIKTDGLKRPVYDVHARLWFWANDG